MNKKLIFFTVIFLCFSLFVSGCDGSSSKKTAILNSCTEVATIMGIAVDEISGTSETITQKTNESHLMMALMILSQADMDNDLENYDHVFLVEVTVPNKDSGMVVVVEKDGVQTTIVPQGFIDRLLETE